MTEISADSDDFAGILDAHRQAEAEARKRALRRAAAAAAVLVVHILALILIASSNPIPIIVHIRETVPEAILWIPMPRHTIQPKKPTDQTTIPEPLTLPQDNAPITIPQKPQALPPPPSEGLRGVGRSIACSATNYENLPPADRETCIRHPWAYVKKPDGTITLEPAKPVETTPSIADIMRHEQQTAPPCPVLQNTPCLSKVIHGDPLGGGPRPF